MKKLVMSLFILFGYQSAVLMACWDGSNGTPIPYIPIECEAGVDESPSAPSPFEVGTSYKKVPVFGYLPNDQKVQGVLRAKLHYQVREGVKGVYIQYPKVYLKSGWRYDLAAEEHDVAGVLCQLFGMGEFQAESLQTGHNPYSASKGRLKIHLNQDVFYLTNNNSEIPAVKNLFCQIESGD